MKYFFVLALAVAVAAAVPVDPKTVTIVAQENDNIGVDRYTNFYENSDGTKAQEEGQLTDVGTENEALVVRGSFSYVGPDGVTYAVTYTADRDGFHPSGIHLPVAPQA